MISRLVFRYFFILFSGRKESDSVTMSEETSADIPWIAPAVDGIIGGARTLHCGGFDPDARHSLYIGNKDINRAYVKCGIHEIMAQLSRRIVVKSLSVSAQEVL